jgi:hypothetical protein
VKGNKRFGNIISGDFIYPERLEAEMVYSGSSDEWWRVGMRLIT